MRQATPPVPPTSEERSTEFVPVEGGGETTSAEALLVTAYLLMWAILFGFIYLSHRRQRALESKLGGLEATVAKVVNRAPGPPLIAP